MGPQRYERVAGHDDEHSPITPADQQYGDRAIPSSPPPSFRSRASSPSSRHFLAEHDPLATDEERTLADAFDSPSDNEGSDSDGERDSDDRRRLMRRTRQGTGDAAMGDDESQQSQTRPMPGVQRRVTQFPSFVPANSTPGRRFGTGMANDGVFANLNAKPEAGEKLEEQPPTYEQAAADAAPPYWETTILAPGVHSDEVFVDGLPVGSVFSFIWNGMISMSFQLVGFLLTYLLHTTHAAKNGSKAGLGITLVQYGFYMKGSGSDNSGGSAPAAGDPQFSQPTDPNAHDFNPSDAVPDTADAASSGGIGANLSSNWLAYALMIVGWFILIRSVSEYFKARRHEQLVLQSPDRGLPVPVVAEGEQAETVV